MLKQPPLKRSMGLLCLMFIVVACNAPNSSAPPPTATVATPPGPTPIPSYVLTTVGAAEVVFDWSSNQCENLDIPDLPVRAFRDADGNVQLISAHITNRRYIGPDLNAVKHECGPVMTSGHDADPSKFNDNEWIASTYTEDGQTIHALIHNEFHGWEHGMCDSGDNFACWYNAVTLAVSNDGGKTYRDIQTPPDHLVASLPNPYESGAGPYGVMEPSNIIKKDSFYYVFVRIDEYQSGRQRICLFRTDSLEDPKSWRAWDGSDFTIANTNPYLDDAKTAPGCAGMDDDLGIMESSITFNTYLNLYVMVGTTAIHLEGREVWGVLYAFSPDLIHWEPRQLLFEAPLPWTFKPGDKNAYLYPSLLDPNSGSRNFETTDQTAYLYLTRFNNYSIGDPLDRDLIRIPVEFFADKGAAAAKEISFEP